MLNYEIIAMLLLKQYNTVECQFMLTYNAWNKFYMG